MEARPRKQAACLPCRRSKTKCHWQPDQHRCQRCALSGCECIRGEYHVGRQKGTKNKRIGLDKALYQIEQAVKRARSSDVTSSEDDEIFKRLRSLLNGDDAGGPYQNGHVSDDGMASSEESDGIADRTPLSGDGHAIESAESPLQLLAVSHRASRRRTATSPARKASRLATFFAPARVSLDVGEDVDPISLGLVSEEEAETLVSFFHTNLAHTRWGLDPRVYDMPFIRSRSAFLLTSVMNASALFIPLAGALSKRLSDHVKRLATNVIGKKHKSVEIVLAFMVNVPWMPPGERSADDETCLYIATATQIALDISLHKFLVPIEAIESTSRANLGRGECIDVRTALKMDGFSDVDSNSPRGKLLLRSRERCWISLFTVERGMCLARGRPFTVPLSRLIRDCNTWHLSDLVDPLDGHLLSMAVLRRNLEGLFNNVRALCDGSQIVASDGSRISQSIQDAIEHFFSHWHAQWDSFICTGPNQQLPPYVEIILTHTRLSIYGGLINHPTAPLEVRQFFRTAGLSSALNVMRAAIQGEARLNSMPNNTSIMISFAACFALTLSAHVTGKSTLAPSIRELIDQTARVLERIGSITSHRNGPSVLYGKQLRQVLKEHQTTAEEATVAPTTITAPPSQNQQSQTEPQAPSSQEALVWPEPLQFSTMSDIEIAQVLNQPGNKFDPYFDGLSWDDFNSFDWLHWPEFT